MGEFAAGESAVLSLANLPQHSALSLSYDLYLIDEDGGALLQSAALSSDLSTAALTGLLPRPKGIAVDVAGGPNLMPLRGLDGTALDVAAVVPAGSPWPAGVTQPNIGNFGLGALPNVSIIAPSSAPVTASLAALSTESSLVGGSYTVYHLQHTFKHTDDVLSLDFSSLPDQPSISGGTWAIDNVALVHLSEQMIRWTFEPGGPTQSTTEPNTHYGDLVVNDDFDEQNYDGAGTLVPDNQPNANTTHAGGHRIVDPDPATFTDDELLSGTLQLGFPDTVFGGFKHQRHGRHQAGRGGVGV